MIRFSRTLFVLAATLAGAGCGAGSGAMSGPAATGVTPVKVEQAKPAAAGGVKAPGDAKVGDTTTCPVSGEEFVVEANSPKAEHDGKTYYLCCGGCKKKFEADPTKFTKR
jgi:Cu+-exporting ATPase